MRVCVRIVGGKFRGGLRAEKISIEFVDKVSGDELWDVVFARRRSGGHHLTPRRSEMSHHKDTKDTKKNERFVTQTFEGLLISSALFAGYCLGALRTANV